MEENRPLNKYKDCKIYAVGNSVDNTIYVGSTIQPLHKRFFEHKYRANKGHERTNTLYLKMNDLGVDKFYIELVEHVPCCSREELNRREGENTVCNSNIAGRTKSEYRHETKEKKKDTDNKYYFSHRQELKQKFKEYYKANKEDIKHRSNEYAFNKKEHRKEYIKEYFKKQR